MHSVYAFNPQSTIIQPFFVYAQHSTLSLATIYVQHADIMERLKGAQRMAFNATPGVIPTPAASI